jgi:general secretion pathway protein E/type IV pilus assembly protein PilB
MSAPLSEADHDAYWRPLGRLLVQRGLLTQDELEAALDEQERTGGLLGEILMRSGLLSRLALASSLHEQSLAPESESGFGSGLRSALGGAEPGAERERAGDEPETEGGFGSGLRRALERHDEG